MIVASGSTRRDNPLAYLAGICRWSPRRRWVGGWVTPPAVVVQRAGFLVACSSSSISGARCSWSLVPAIVTVMMTDLFDSLSTFIGVAQAAQSLDEKGEPKNLRQGLIVDAVATLGAGLFGSSSGTAYVESIAGIRMGGRTGLTAVVTALCFLPCLFIAPLAAAVPPYATAAVLIMVGVVDVPDGDAHLVRSARDRACRRLRR